MFGSAMPRSLFLPAGCSGWRSFDLLSLDGSRITPLPLFQRKVLRAKLVAAAGDCHLQFSGDFSDPIKLLETCQKMNLEGIVSKQRASAYRSGPTRLAEDQDGDVAGSEPGSLGAIRKATLAGGCRVIGVALRTA